MSEIPKLGAPSAAPNNIYKAGICFVVYGDPQLGNGGFFNLEELNGKNGFQIPGLAPGDEVGSFGAGIGDINVDGTDDLIVANSFDGSYHIKA